VWNDVEHLADAPEALYTFLEGIAPPTAGPSPSTNGQHKQRGIIAKGIDPTSREFRIERARSYLATIDPAVQGEGGSNATYRAARAAVRGFDLTIDEARPLLKEYSARCDPPWSDEELEHKLADAASKPFSRPRGWLLDEAVKKAEASDPDPAERRGYNQTDLGNSRRMVHKYGTSIRWSDPWRIWLVWDGARWAIDRAKRIDRLGSRTVKSIYRELASVGDNREQDALYRHATRSEARKAIVAMIDGARCFVPILPEELDSNPWLLNVQNGTIDLRTGELRPHRRDDYITKLAPVVYDPDATCPLWLDTLAKAFRPDDPAEAQALIGYLQRVCGCALSGSAREHILLGTGKNGKTTILDTIQGMLGEYGTPAPPGFLMMRKYDAHPTEFATLYGRRVVVVSETGAGATLNEERIKLLTGGDMLTARRMHEDFWEFKPTHTLMIGTNYKPRIVGTGDAIWRRVKIVPFTNKIEPADPTVPERLRAE
jgi:putative DNA primase/helicase